MCIILVVIFGLLSSSLLLLVKTRFGCCIRPPTSGVFCLYGHRNDFKMISQVESFRCLYKQGTPEEDRRIQRPKRCVSINRNKDEDNSPKNHKQYILIFFSKRVLSSILFCNFLDIFQPGLLSDSYWLLLSFPFYSYKPYAHRKGINWTLPINILNSKLILLGLSTQTMNTKLLLKLQIGW